MKKGLIWALALIMALCCLAGCGQQALSATEYKTEIKDWAEYCIEQMSIDSTSSTSVEQFKEMMLNVKQANDEIKKLVPPSRCEEIKNKVLEFTTFLDKNYDNIIETYTAFIDSNCDISKLSYDQVSLATEFDSFYDIIYDYSKNLD